MSHEGLEIGNGQGLSELLRHARNDGPQVITIRGAETAVVLSADDFRRLANGPEAGSWVDRFRAGFARASQERSI